MNKTRPQETIDFKSTKSMNFFSIDTPIDLEEQKRMLRVTN